MRNPLVLTLTILLATLGLALAQAPADKPIAAALQPMVEKSELAGAVTLVANKDKVLDVTTVGYADIAAKKPMTPDTLFWIASMTKGITGAAFMILVDEGKVSLDDPIEKYLPEMKGLMVETEKDENHVLLKKPDHLVTVREVLCHTSGMPFKSAMEDPTLDALPLRVAVKSYAITPLDYQPGTKYLYSNAGINTAGRIIEVVSGLSYEAFMDSRLFQPLRMKDTTFWPNAEQLTRLAKGYKPNADKTALEETTVAQLQYPLDQKAGRYPMPAGGLFSTAEDVGRFCRMLMNGGQLDGTRVLSEKAVHEVIRRQTPPDLVTSYGLGFQVNENTYGHGGAWATNMTVDTKANLVMVYLIQHTGGFLGEGKNGGSVFQKAAREAFGAK